MRRRLAVFLPLIAILPIGDVYAALTVSVMPPILDLSVPAGMRKAFKLTVRNMGDLVLVLTPVVMDLKLSTTGAAMPVEPRSTARSCADWVSVETDRFVLEPGQKREIEMLFEVPRGVKGGRYCVILFEANPVETGADRPHLAVVARTGTIIMETIPGRSVRSGEITDLNVAKTDENMIGITAYFKNKGDIHVQIKPGCMIRNLEGRVVDRVEMDAGTGTVLPEGMRVINGAWSNKRRMKPGTYVAEVYADYKGRKRASKSIEFTIE